MQIDTERLIMREFHEDDWPAMLAYWKDPLYQRYYPEREDLGMFALELVGLFVGAQYELPRTKWQLALVKREDGRFIGNCGIRINDVERREANIGYEVSPSEWGRGYATEAATAIARFGFEELGLHRVWAECVADNAGSIRVLEKLGMQREAHFREHQWCRERWWDTLIYAILDREWAERQAEI